MAFPQAAYASKLESRLITRGKVTILMFHFGLETFGFNDARVGSVGSTFLAQRLHSLSLLPLVSSKLY